MNVRSLGLRFFLVLVVGLVLASVAACGSAASPASSGAPSGAASAGASSGPSAAASAAASTVIGGSGALASVELRGGECISGICATVITLDADGRIHLAAKPPNDLGTATAAQVKALQDAIDATDFGALRKPAFRGTCPTAYDGQELIFQFTTAHGAERLASCESTLDFNAPVFKALVAALGDSSPLNAVK